MSHALLLRLFLSPSFFSVHVALYYLSLYFDNVGITYYLTRRLEGLDINELRDAWGLICHLLITRLSRSRALECFVVRMSQRSTHLAMFTLWFMQAYLKDLSPTGQTSKAFAVCQRVLHRCHEIFFDEDHLGVAAGPYGSIKLPYSKFSLRTPVKPRVFPAIVGIGCVLAGTPGMPTLTSIVGAVAIEQGRGEEDSHKMRSIEGQDSIGGHLTADAVDWTANSQEHHVETDDDEDDGQSAEVGVEPTEPRQALADAQYQIKNPKMTFSSCRQIIDAAQTSPSLPLHRATIPARTSEDPFGQLEAPQSVSVSTPYWSSPSISLIDRRHMSSNASMAEELLQQYDLPSQNRLLRSHYFRSEIQFMLALESISNRLLVVPKPARVSALRAELTSLNHTLPAEICIPMWCTLSDTSEGEHGIPEAHHRVVRIPPGESVVLNSAERVPFLLLVEILNNDLDFDPTKRGNKEVLKKSLSKGYDFLGTFPDLRRSRIKSDAAGDTSHDVEGADVARSKDTLDGTLTTFSTETNDPRHNAESDDVRGEEVDLVEQIYGPDLSVRLTPDISDSLMLPPSLKNKALDIAAWSKSSSWSPSPSLTPRSSTSVHVYTKPDNFLEQVADRRDDPKWATSLDSPVRSSILSLDEYSERMQTAATMLSQLNANIVRQFVTPLSSFSTSAAPGAYIPSDRLPGWLLKSNWISGTRGADSVGPLYPPLSGNIQDASNPVQGNTFRMKLQPSEATAIRDRIMQEMLALEEERMERMRETSLPDVLMGLGQVGRNLKTAEDEAIIRRELNKVDPSAVVFQEPWPAKKSRIRQGSPYGHLASWDCVSVIVKTGADLRQEQLAVQLIREFERIWQEENCQCWVRSFRILITGGLSGLVETITDAVSIHSIKKTEYARRLAAGRLGHVSLLDHFISTYGTRSSAKFLYAQRNFAKSLAGYSIVTYLLQIKDRHNGNILLDGDGHLIHIDFGFMLSSSPGNIGFEAAPFKLPFEYVEVLGGLESDAFAEFKRLFRQGFEATRKHCDRIITIVELMQRDSSLPCFAALGEQTAQQLRERLQSASMGDHVERLIMTSLGSNWTRLYDSYQYYAQSIL